MVFNGYPNVTGEMSSSVHRANQSPLRQNSVHDLYSLMKFLKIKPLSDRKIFDEQIAIPIGKGRNANLGLQRLQVRSLICKRRRARH